MSFCHPDRFFPKVKSVFEGKTCFPGHLYPLIGGDGGVVISSYGKSYDLKGKSHFPGHFEIPPLGDIGGLGF